MNELLNKLIMLNEDTSGLNAAYRVYHCIEQNIDPDRSDVFAALHMMEKYYHDYIIWYNKYVPAEVRAKDKLIMADYRKRLHEIRSALYGANAGEQLVALDTSINQWHRDFPVIAHLGMDQADEDNEGYELSWKIAKILQKLGRLPLDSPYVNGGKPHR